MRIVLGMIVLMASVFALIPMMFVGLVHLSNHASQLTMEPWKLVLSGLGIIGFVVAGRIRDTVASSS